MAKRQKNNSNQFRIIAGEYRHRVLGFPDAIGLRPTPDRVRETLFNWIQPLLAGAHCLDLFSGSGALAFEALSRGAAQVTALELSGKASDSLKNNALLLDENRLTVINQDALVWLQSPRASAFDIIFLDPPYSLRLLQDLVATIDACNLLNPGGTLYLEDNQPLDDLSLPPGWLLSRSKKAGQVFYGLCTRSG